MPDETETPHEAHEAHEPDKRDVAIPANVVTVGNLLNWGKFVLAVIPILAWFIKLEVGNAERDMRIAQIESDMEEMQDDLDEALDIDKGVQANALKLVQLEGKLDTANVRLSEIKELLHD